MGGWGSYLGCVSLPEGTVRSEAGELTTVSQDLQRGPQRIPSKALRETRAQVPLRNGVHRCMHLHHPTSRYIHVITCLYVHISLITCLYVYMHTNIILYIYICLRIYIYMCVCVKGITMYIYIYICICIYV